MADQFAVVYFPDSTLVVEAIGPFRAEWRAELAREAITYYASEHLEYGTAPQVVRLGTLDEALARIPAPEPDDIEHK